VVDGTLRLALGEDAASGPGTHVIRDIPGGWEVTGPDGQRLLCARGAGAIPSPPGDAAPYDFAVLDMLAGPAQLGLLRGRGLVTDSTGVALACADHRASSEREVTECSGFWGVQAMRDGEEIQHRRFVKAIRRVLVIGGARSGKSERAELRVSAEPSVTYVAAGASRADDAEWSARVAAHQARRPAWWRTVETTDLVGLLTDPGGTLLTDPGGTLVAGHGGTLVADSGGTLPVDSGGTLLIDGIGTWLAAVMDECGAWDGSAATAERLAARVAEFVRAWRETCVHVVAVSDETGLSIVPDTPVGRFFRDQLGWLNQALSRESEVTEFVLAGRTLSLPL